MDQKAPQFIDEQMMRRCFALALRSAKQGEYPYGAVVTRGGEIIAEATNRVARDHDITHHAEIVAMAEAQQRLGSTNLSGCTLYCNVEPCALCSYAIRESRLGRVVYAMCSPVMGGASRWDILNDQGLSTAIPEVFVPPPEVVPGLLAEEADVVLRQIAPLTWAFIRAHDLLLIAPQNGAQQPARRSTTLIGLLPWLTRALRLTLSDRFGRGGGK
ncbi:MAG TPA: nucleoside deaminase [Pseudolabrys sp.]|jgi:tRNA(adenine34) deaminase|nr:nucleoside deaminase [Pseudolabrys sp.]